MPSLTLPLATLPTKVHQALEDSLSHWLAGRRWAHARLTEGMADEAIVRGLRHQDIPDRTLAEMALLSARRLRQPHGRYVRFSQALLSKPTPTWLADEAAFREALAPDPEAPAVNLQPLPTVKVYSQHGRLWADIRLSTPSQPLRWVQNVPLDVPKRLQARFLRYFTPVVSANGRVMSRPCLATLSWAHGGLVIELTVPRRKAAPAWTPAVTETAHSHFWEVSLPRVAAAALILQPTLPAVAADHTVQHGETLSSISRMHYGPAATWHPLYATNRQTVANPHRIYPGMVLHLPESTAAVAHGGLVVRRGDTLYDLAARHLGNGAKWTALWHANRGRIASPDLIYAGTHLTMPGSSDFAYAPPARHPAPQLHAYHPAPVYRAPAHHAAAPVHHPAPVQHAAAPVHHPAPVQHAAAPVHHPAPAPLAVAPVHHPEPVHQAAAPTQPAVAPATSAPARLAAPEPVHPTAPAPAVTAPEPPAATAVVTPATDTPEPPIVQPDNDGPAAVAVTPAKPLAPAQPTAPVAVVPPDVAPVAAAPAPTAPSSPVMIQPGSAPTLASQPSSSLGITESPIIQQSLTPPGTTAKPAPDPDGYDENWDSVDLVEIQPATKPADPFTAKPMAPAAKAPMTTPALTPPKAAVAPPAKPAIRPLPVAPVAKAPVPAVKPIAPVAKAPVPAVKPAAPVAKAPTAKPATTVAHAPAGKVVTPPVVKNPVTAMTTTSTAPAKPIRPASLGEDPIMDEALYEGDLSNSPRLSTPMSPPVAKPVTPPVATSDTAPIQVARATTEPMTVAQIPSGNIAAKPLTPPRLYGRPFRTHAQLMYNPVSYAEALPSQDLIASGSITKALGGSGAWRLADPVELAANYLYSDYRLDREGGDQAIRTEHHGRMMGYYVLPILPELEVAGGLGAQLSSYSTAAIAGTAGDPAPAPAAARVTDLFDSNYQRLMVQAEAKVGYQPIKQVPFTVTAGLGVMPYGKTFQATAVLPDTLWGYNWSAGARYAISGVSIELNYRGQQILGASDYKQGSDMLQLGVGYEFQ